MGQRSYGKGLVQSTRPLGYNSFLKLTTGKYYIPSGRCIQKLDYSSHDNREGREVADSTLKSFTTAAGRVVYDGGGIRPDIELEAQYISRFAVTLYGLGFIEDFVDDYMKRNFGKDIDLENFSITDEDYADFVAFMQDKEVNYESASRNMLKMMKEAAKSDNFKELQEQIALLEQNLKDDKMTNLETYREEIIETINSDIVLRHAYSEGLIKYNLKKDKEIARAIELLQNIEEYNSILSPKN